MTTATANRIANRIAANARAGNGNVNGFRIAEWTDQTGPMNLPYLLLETGEMVDEQEARDLGIALQNLGIDTEADDTGIYLVHA